MDSADEYPDPDEVARDVVREFAPDELVLFEQTAKALRGRRPKAGRGGADDLLGIGMGIVESVITVAVIAGTKAAFAQFVQESEKNGGTAVIRRIKRQLNKFLRRSARSVPETSTPLTKDQLATVRTAALAELAAFKLPDDLSSRIAYSIVGRLAVPSRVILGRTS